MEELVTCNDDNSTLGNYWLGIILLLVVLIINNLYCDPSIKLLESLREIIGDILIIWEEKDGHTGPGVVGSESSR